MRARDCLFPSLEKLSSRTARHALRWVVMQNAECERLEWGGLSLTVCDVDRMAGKIARWFFIGVRLGNDGQTTIVAGFASSNRAAIFQGGLRLGSGASAYECA